MIDFVVTATDPLGEQLSYALSDDHVYKSKWQSSGSLSMRIKEADVSTNFSIDLQVKSLRKYHARRL